MRPAVFRRSLDRRRRPVAAAAALLIAGLPSGARAEAVVPTALDWQPPGTGQMESGSTALPGGRVPDRSTPGPWLDSAGTSSRRTAPDGPVAARSVPEPATVSLLGAGLLALVVTAGRRRRLR